MTDEREAFKCSCGYACESKYALKKHKRYCDPMPRLQYDRTDGTVHYVRAPFNGSRGTTAKSQGFTETYIKANDDRSTSARLHPERK